MQRSNSTRTNSRSEKKTYKKHKEITASFKEDGSAANLKKIWEVAFGTFDRKKGWAKELADIFMKKHGWEYDLSNAPARRRTYCIEQQVAKTKSEMIKNMNAAVMKTHKNTIGISRDKKDITDKTKFEKRTKAIFQPRFIVSHVSSILILSDVLLRLLTTFILVRNICIG